MIDLPTTDGVYLVHFERRIGGDGRNGAQHYLGWAADIAARITHHRRASDAAIMRYVTAAGILWDVVAVWPGATRDDERRWKKAGHHGDRRCPVCRAETVIEKSSPRALCTDRPGRILQI